MSNVTKESLEKYLEEYLKNNQADCDDMIRDLSATIRSYYDKARKQEEEKRKREVAIKEARIDLIAAAADYIDALAGGSYTDDEYEILCKDIETGIKEVESDLIKIFSFKKKLAQVEKTKKSAGTDDEILRNFFGSLK